MRENIFAILAKQICFLHGSCGVELTDTVSQRAAEVGRRGGVRAFIIPRKSVDAAALHIHPAYLHLTIKTHHAIITTACARTRTPDHSSSQQLSHGRLSSGYVKKQKKKNPPSCSSMVNHALRMSTAQHP